MTRDNIPMDREPHSEALEQAIPAFSILITEDDPATRDALCLMIKIRFPDCTIHSARNGMEGVKQFEQHAPDIVITDVNMPAMDGMEMVQIIKEIKGDARFIVLTAYGDAAHLEKFKKLGYCAYIAKPVELSELFAAIYACLGVPPPENG